MKFYMCWLFVVVSLFWIPSAHGWGMATHILMAEQAMNRQDPEVFLGSMMADFNQAAFDDADLNAAISQLTHYEFDRLDDSWFAMGIATHNNVWGTDWFSHQYWLPDIPESEWYYSTQKINQLAEELNISLLEAEYYFEMAVELLLRVDTGPDLGNKILWATTTFNSAHLASLIEGFAEPLSESMAGMTLLEAEKTLQNKARLFQRMLQGYGLAYVEGELALANLLTAVGVFYLNEKPLWVAYNLRYAVELCRDDYRAELDRVSDILKLELDVHYPHKMEENVWGCRASEDKTSPASLVPLLMLGILLKPCFRQHKIK